MAKSVSIIKLRGTVDGLTFVRSRTYGEHHILKKLSHIHRGIVNMSCLGSKQTQKTNDDITNPSLRCNAHRDNDGRQRSADSTNRTWNNR